MINQPHACDIPILMQCEIWAEDEERAVGIVAWIKDRIMRQGLMDLMINDQVEVKLVQVAANEAPTHIRICFGKRFSIIARKDDGLIVCPSCCGSGIVHWAHKPNEVCVICNTTGLLKESIYLQLPNDDADRGD